jgi:2,3,4,5-tetrahydropyridine-2-carboxylate N-succinyltransferase
MDLHKKIEELYTEAEKSNYNEEKLTIFEEFKFRLNNGLIRAAEFKNGEWKVNEWVKKGILLGFRIGAITEYSLPHGFKFWDKNTYPLKNFTLENHIRIVPGGTSIRDGADIAERVIIMPPAYINVGAYVDEETLIDSHALVGSCAQVGKKCHVSAGVMIGGVIEPIGSKPVIVEDNVFLGGQSGLYEGVIVKQNAVLAPGTIISGSTPIYDSISDKYLEKKNGVIEIPEGAVVVPGSRPLRSNPAHQIYCPIIIKYRDEKTDSAVILEDLIR